MFYLYSSFPSSEPSTTTPKIKQANYRSTLYFPGGSTLNSQDILILHTPPGGINRQRTSKQLPLQLSFDQATTYPPPPRSPPLCNFHFYFLSNVFLISIFYILLKQFLL